MLIGNNMRTGVGNSSHTVALIQSDTTNLSTTFTDTSRGGTTHTVNRGGVCTHSTARQVFGTTSIATGSGAWLYLSNNADLDTGLGDFTYETWLYRNNNLAQNIMSQLTASPLSDMSMIISADAYNRILGYTSPDGTALDYSKTANGSVVAGRWYHVVFQRNGNICRTYLDGFPSADFENIAYSVHASSEDFYIGRFLDGTQPLRGYLDEIRITKGLAAYPKSGFTVPNRMS